MRCKIDRARLVALRPMLQQAGVLATPFVSTRRDEFAEIIASAREDGEVDLENRGGTTASTTSAPIGAVVAGATRALRSLDDFDGIVAVGGDGTFFEVGLPLHRRPDVGRLSSVVLKQVLLCLCRTCPDVRCACTCVCVCAFIFPLHVESERGSRRGKYVLVADVVRYRLLRRKFASDFGVVVHPWQGKCRAIVFVVIQDC